MPTLFEVLYFFIFLYFLNTSESDSDIQIILVNAFKHLFGRSRDLVTEYQFFHTSNHECFYHLFCPTTGPVSRGRVEAMGNDIFYWEGWYVVDTAFYTSVF